MSIDTSANYLLPPNINLGDGSRLDLFEPEHSSRLTAISNQQRRLPRVTQRWVRECLAQTCLGGTRQSWSAWHGQALLGGYSLRLFEADGLVEIDYTLDWRQAASSVQLAARATALARQVLFDACCYQRIDINCDPESPIDLPVAEQTGMIYELTRRNGLAKTQIFNRVRQLHTPLYASVLSDWHGE